METSNISNENAKFWITVCVIYLILLGILLSLRFSRAVDPAWQGVIGTALVAMLPLSVILLPFAIWRTRHGLLALILLLPLIALIILSAPYFVPRSQLPIADRPTLTVLTLNIHKPSSPEALNEIAATIREVDADIVALQELGTSPDTLFRPLLEAEYPYQSLHLDEAYPGSGQGVLSKYPIVAEEYWKAGGEWNGNLRVEIDFEGQSIIVYNVHPHPPIERGLDPQVQSHERTLLNVYERAASENHPMLLIGDFNLTTEFRAYQVIEGDYHDAFREVGDVGFGFTHPHFAGVPLPPFWRVDYVFYDPLDFHGLEAHMLQGMLATDHLPLLVRLQLLDQ